MAVRYSFIVNGQLVSSGAGQIKESSEAQVRKVITMKMHPNHYFTKNDIALLKTENQFQKLYFTDTVLLSGGIKEIRNTPCFQIGKNFELVNGGHFVHKSP